MTPLQTQARTYGTKEDLLEDRDDPIDERIFPGKETSSEEDDDDHNEDEFEDDPSQRKPASGLDQIMFYLLPDDWGKQLLTRLSELQLVDSRAQIVATCDLLKGHAALKTIASAFGFSRSSHR
jgi:hypothetical protein